jgi:O-antigen/teichoic acid export membrane protein
VRPVRCYQIIMFDFDAWLTRLVARLPGGARLNSLTGRLASFADQGIQGVGNVVVSAILARSLTHEGFAAIGLMLGVHYFILGTHRSGIVLPYILTSADAEARGGGHGRDWWWFNLSSVGVICALLIAVASAATLALRSYPDLAWIATALRLAAVVSPSLILAEFGRRMLYQMHRPATAAFCSTVYFVLNVGGAVLVFYCFRTAEAGAATWIVGGLASAGVSALSVWPGRPRLGRAVTAWWSNRSFAFWQVLTNVPYSVYNSSAVLLVGAFGGAIATAAFTVARTVTNPAISMVTAVDSMDKPRAARAAARDGVAGLKASIRRTRMLLLMLTGSYLGLLVIFAGPLLALAFGDAYRAQANEIRVLAVAFFLICMNQPSETLLIVCRQSRLMLTTRLLAAGFCVVAIFIGSKFGLMGVAIGLATTQLFNLVNLHMAEWIAVRRFRQSDFTPASASVTVEAGEASEPVTQVGG